MGELKYPGFRFNNFFSRIGYLAVGSLLKFFVQLAIVILYSHKLSLTDYGIYQFIWMYINFFSVMGLFGVTTLMLSTSLPSLTVWVKANKKLLLFLFAAVNSLALLFLFVSGTYFSPYEKTLLVILLFLQNVSLIAESLAIKNEEEKKLFYSNLAYTIIYAFIHFYILYNTYSVTALLEFVIIATIVKCIILFYGSKPRAFEVKQHNTIGKQWLLLGINDILGVLVKWTDKWLILFFLPAAEFAVYFNGTYEIPVFMIILGAIGSVSLVDFSKIKENDGSGVKVLFEKPSLLMASLVFPAFWFFLFYSDAFILTLFGSKYAASIPIFEISILILPVRIIYSTTVLQVYNRTDLIVKGSVIDFIIGVLLMWILYPFWGIRGLAIAFVISTYIQVGYYLWHTGKLIGQNISYFLPFRKLLVLMLTGGLLIAASNYLVNDLGMFYRLLTGITVSAAVIFMSLYFSREKSSAY